MIPYSTCMRFNTRRHSLQNDKYCPAEWTLVQHIGFNTRVESTFINVTSQDDQTLCFTWAIESQNTQPCDAGGLLVESPLLAKERSQSDELDRRSVYLLLALRRRKSLQQSIHPETIPLLDPYYYGISARYLKYSYKWSFNTFSFDVLTSGHSLSSLLLYFFKEYRFMEIFNLDLINVLRCFHYLEKGYHDTNPYHNSVHAADVTQAMHCFLQEPKIKQHLTPLEAMCSLLAAVSHDLDHPGVNQQFLIATNSHLTTMHNNLSVLESHHWRFALSCFYESHIFDHFDQKQWKEIKFLLKHLILATDISRQSEFLHQFRHYIKMGDQFRMDRKEHKYFILQIALKCADLGNPCRPWKISQRWSEQICNEFYRQGDFERLLGLPVTPMCDRNSTTISKTQTDFFKNVVRPLFDLWNLFLDSKLTRQLINNLNFNEYMWKNMESKYSTIKRCHSLITLPDELTQVNHYVQRTKSPATVERIVRRKSLNDDELSSIYHRHQLLPTTKLKDGCNKAEMTNLETTSPQSTKKKCINGCGTPSSSSSLSSKDDNTALTLSDEKSTSTSKSSDVIRTGFDADHLDEEDEHDDFIADFNCGAILSTPALILPNFCFEKPQSGFYRRGSAPGCIDIRRNDFANQSSTTTTSNKGHALLLLCNSLKATGVGNIKRRSSFPNVVKTVASGKVATGSSSYNPTSLQSSMNVNLLRLNAAMIKNCPELVSAQSIPLALPSSGHQHKKHKKAKKRTPKQQQQTLQEPVQRSIRVKCNHHHNQYYHHYHPQYHSCRSSLYDITNNNNNNNNSLQYWMAKRHPNTTNSYQRRRSVPQDIFIRSLNNYTA